MGKPDERKRLQGYEQEALWNLMAAEQDAYEQLYNLGNPEDGSLEEMKAKPEKED